MVKVNFATDIKNLDQLNRNCKRASLDDVTELLLVMYASFANHNTGQSSFWIEWTRSHFLGKERF